MTAVQIILYIFLYIFVGIFVPLFLFKVVSVIFDALGEPEVTKPQESKSILAHVLFCFLHFFAILFGLFGLFITIPLHLIYCAVANTGKKVFISSDIDGYTSKKCPYCQMDVNEKATKCPHCQSSI